MFTNFAPGMWSRNRTFSSRSRQMDYSILDFLGLLGAVGLFLYGMKVMSEGLQKSRRRQAAQYSVGHDA